VRRDHWQRRIAELDPETDFAEIHRVTAARGLVEGALRLRASPGSLGELEP
jgi:hypothetical protein